MIHNIAPTYLTLYKRQFSHNAMCPICREHEERTIHFLKYNDSNDVQCQYFCTHMDNKFKEKLMTITISSSAFMNQYLINQKLGWHLCIRIFLMVEWIEVARHFKHEKTDNEALGWIIVALWKTWSAAWKTCNQQFKKEDQYLAQTAKMQHTVDFRIIY
jgi:hypothetical protein